MCICSEIYYSTKFYLRVEEEIENFNQSIEKISVISNLAMSSDISW